MIKLTSIDDTASPRHGIGIIERPVFINPHLIVAIRERWGEAYVLFVGDCDGDKPLFRFKESVEEILLLINGSSQQDLPAFFDKTN